MRHHPASPALHSLVQQAVRRHEPPFYLIDLIEIEKNIDRVVHSWRSRFPLIQFAYSYKTNPLSVITRMVRNYGGCAEVVSGTELGWALQDGFAPKKIVFNGPVKSKEELVLALENCVAIQLDSVEEAELLVSLSRQLRLTPRVIIRLSHRCAQGFFSRFGLNELDVQLVIKLFVRNGFLIDGVHFHLGSNLNASQPYVEMLRVVFQLLNRQPNIFKAPPIINIGSGFAAHTVGDGTKPLPAAQYARDVCDTVRKNKLDSRKLRIMIEPGRTIVEDCGHLVARVISRKRREDREILVLNVGTNNARSINGWHHPISHIPQHRNVSKARRAFAIAGCQCYESDLFTNRFVTSSSAQRGDLFVFSYVGGYDLTTANAWTRPGLPIVGYGRRGIVRLERGMRLSNVSSTPPRLG